MLYIIQVAYTFIEAVYLGEVMYLIHVPTGSLFNSCTLFKACTYDTSFDIQGINAVQAVHLVHVGVRY